MSWLLQQAEALAGQPSPDPNNAGLLALGFSRFVEACPGDFLEPLLGSPFGRVFKLFLERCCTQGLPGNEIEQRKQELSQKLRLSGFQGPEGHGLLLALMPFFPPQQLKVEDAAAKLPGWLLELYKLRYEPPTASPTAPSGEPSFSDRIFLNRILGLSNLYYIDPEDQEILQELRQVRLQTIDLLLGVNRDQLGQHFSGDFGDRYWAMAQSGVQKEALDATEINQRDALQQWLTRTPNSLSSEGGIQRFAAALLFAIPGSVQLANPEQNLPAWFLEGFRRYCSTAVPA
ncbi:MAG: hypothetical protein EBR69_06115 [Synechococcaceae bacterium WB4_2_0805]|nr:hypothetical protein [Synechococcaceae bacterium WB4_2_0805]